MFHQEQPAVFEVHGKPWSIWLDGQKLCQDIPAKIVDHIHGQAALHWWEHKGCFLSSDLCSIDWDACKKTVHISTVTRRQWIAKHAIGMCGVGKMMKIWKQQWPTNNCPQCGDYEDAAHV